MSIWKSPLAIADVNAVIPNTLAESLAIKFTEIGDDYVIATMPVDHRSKQPMGVLHGGASAALAEAVGSLAANMAAKPGFFCVGLDINANHLRSVCEGLITAVATPAHIVDLLKYGRLISLIKTIKKCVYRA